MNRPNLACALALTALALAPIACTAQQVISAGPWSATLGSTGPDEIRYQDEIVARNGRLVGYLPDWKGTRFAMGGAELTVEGETATWTRAVEGNQEATLTLALTPEKILLSLTTTVTAAGPSEFSLQILPEAVRTDETRCFGWLNGEGFEAPLNAPTPFEKIPGIREFRFEQPERTVTLRCEGFELQDRRAAGGELFLVQVIGSPGTEPRTVERSIELSIEDAPAETVAGRTEFLQQRMVEYGEVGFENPGFDADQPMSGWSTNPNAAVDTETFHSRPASVRIRLDGTETDENPYVTRQIPVSAGHLYQAEAWVKTEDVTAATKRGMATTGATVIMEFADKDGKWFASGSYAKGLYGTRDWTRVATGPVRAPAGAGYAIIFLSLRANGAAWFDDVKLSTVKYYTMLMEPLPGATVDDNTPRFSWRTQLLGSGVVQLSQDPAFPADQTIEVPAPDGPSVELRKALDPGTWHWRVRIPEVDDTSHSFTFVQTAPADRDCTEPLVAGEHGYVERTDLPAEVTIADDHDLATADVVATVNGEPARITRAEVTRKDGGDYSVTVQVRPAQTWARGLNKVTVTATDAAGNVGSGTIFRTWCEAMPRTVWTTHQGIEVDGQRKFPFGMYGILSEHVPTMEEAGFDLVHNYSWDGAGSLASAIEYLDTVHAHGMQAFMGLDRKMLQAGNEEFVAERVGALMSHPGLLCWYLYDEPDLLHQYVSPEWMERFYRLIKALDPFHPVVVTCAGDAPVGQYKDSFDVHWTQVYGATSFVASRIPRHRALMKPDWPLAAILHCYDRAQTGLADAGTEFDPDKFQPDARVLRANAFMAVAKESSGLLWWWWGQGSPRYMTIAQVPWAWDALKQVVADIRSLEPILVADGTDQTWIETPEEGFEVHFREKRTANGTLIIAVNRDDKPCRVTFRPRTIPADCRLAVLFEDRQVAVSDGAITEEFEGLGVHVYQFPAP